MEEIDTSNITWSISRISTWLECPLKAKIRYIDKIKSTTPSEALEKGKKLHDYYDKFYDYFDNEIEEAEDKAVNNLKFDEDFQNKYAIYALNFREFVQINPQKPYLKEKRYFAKDEDGDNWVGIIDRVDKINDNEVMIVDYKTSKGSLDAVSKEKRIMKVNGKIEIKKSDYLPQLLSYAKIFELSEEEKVKQVAIFFTANQTDLSKKNITSEDIEKNWKEMVEKKRKVKEIMQGPYEPKLGSYCYWCEYRDMCPLKRGYSK